MTRCQVRCRWPGALPATTSKEGQWSDPGPTQGGGSVSMGWHRACPTAINPQWMHVCEGQGHLSQNWRWIAEEICCCCRGGLAHLTPGCTPSGSVAGWCLSLLRIQNGCSPCLQQHKMVPFSFTSPTWMSPRDFMYTDLLLLYKGPPFCLHCHSKGLSWNWADFQNLRFEYLLNYWSNLSEINCNGFSFKHPLHSKRGMKQFLAVA